MCTRSALCWLREVAGLRGKELSIFRRISSRSHLLSSCTSRPRGSAHHITTTHLHFVPVACGHAMGFLDKLKESFGADDKPKSFEVTFVEQHLGITLSPGPNGESQVTGGAQQRIVTAATWHESVAVDGGG